MQHQTIDFDKLVGSKATLYKRNEQNCFQLGSVLFEIMEDESDGYRSAMQEARVLARDANGGERVGEVVIKNQKDAQDFTGWELVDTNDGHIWLKFGTNNLDDYYPCFVFQWEPKPVVVPITDDGIDDLKRLLK